MTCVWPSMVCLIRKLTLHKYRLRLFFHHQCHNWVLVITELTNISIISRDCGGWHGRGHRLESEKRRLPVSPSDGFRKENRGRGRIEQEILPSSKRAGPFPVLQQVNIGVRSKLCQHLSGDVLIFVHSTSIGFKPISLFIQLLCSNCSKSTTLKDKKKIPYC